MTPKKWYLLPLATILFACGGKTDSPEPKKEASSWTVGNYVYNSFLSAQSKSYDGPHPYLIFNSYTIPSNEYDYAGFTGSNITVKFYTNNGTGPFTLTSAEELEARPTEKFITITCNIGTSAPRGEAVYQPTINTGAIVIVTKDNNGDYKFNMLTKATIVKTGEIEGGIPGAAATYDFILTNAR
ncbi:hypothetical protein KTO58_26860 [Chitinophaga pendula]|uniref:hypothetical protein n=1 Tax=Chitinophaga TaxID=79328 RepID=UPI000BAF267B|nr:MULTISPECIES: hypothetical protein [Chitinophaga]ASZ09820.1 hypothetical protein CK934_01905 [Chitinophaga sp. MD30]UCJ07239.1 hypothetical protein KTO58_26860 [Chitinophaga pendula]